jgi:hypothetical protein
VAHVAELLQERRHSKAQCTSAPGRHAIAREFCVRGPGARN